MSATQGVFVYSNTLKLITTINVPSPPIGLALDGAGDLYIANGGTNGIPVYKNDYKTLVATLNDPNASRGIAVAPNGIVGVVDFPPSAGGLVSFFAGGSTTPCASLPVPSVGNLYQGTFDAAGNFYVSGQDLNHNGIVGVIRGGCSATAFTRLSTANALGEYIYGIQINRFGKLVVGSQSNRALYTYDLPGPNGALGRPIATTAFPANTSAMYQFGFTAKGAFLYAAESPGFVGKYAYPAGGNLLQSFGQKQQLNRPYGLVVAPSAQP